MNQPDLQQLLQRYQAGNCTPAEQHQVEQWYDLLEHGPLLMTSDEQERLRQALWHRVASTLVDADENATPTETPPTPAAAPRRYWGRWAAAAVLAAGLGMGAWQLRPAHSGPGTAAAAAPQRWQTLRNTTPHDLPLTLADGSTVQLAPGSRLRYPMRFGGPRREVQLAGEAFFQIHHDKAHPFQVYTDQLVTTVLGTSFRVRAYAGQPQALVKVSTGRVRVTPRQLPAAASAEAASVEVVPNQQAVYSAGRQPLRRELVAAPVQIQPQSFEFVDRPVAEVLTALETSYGVEIEYDAEALTGCTVNLNLRQESLYGKLEMLCKVLGASYQQQDARIIFHSAGCQSS